MSEQARHIDAENVLSGTFRGRNTHTEVFEVTEKYQSHGHVFLTLRFPGQENSPILTIAYPHEGKADVAEGDKIEFEPTIDYKTGDIVRQKFFENENDVLMVSAITYWKPNVPVLEGWKRLRNPIPQTQFIARPR
jgi:hypothetical protein